jgi:hypothetical protein
MVVFDKFLPYHTFFAAPEQNAAGQNDYHDTVWLEMI